MFDCALVCSEKDRAIAQQRHGGVQVEVFASGADLPAVAPSASRVHDGRTVVFLGAMDYQPNEDAVLFFVESVVPRLRERAPGFRFVVAGKSPSPRVRALDSGRDLSVTGYVDDKAALFASTTVFVVPIRIGGGTRIKILERGLPGFRWCRPGSAQKGSTRLGERASSWPTRRMSSPAHVRGCCWTLPAARASATRVGGSFPSGNRWDRIRNRYAATVRRLAVGRPAK